MKPTHAIEPLWRQRLQAALVAPLVRLSLNGLILLNPLVLGL